MKIRTERAALADALTWVTRVTPKNPDTPALAGVRLVAADGRLTAQAFDWETSHQAAVVAEVADGGECLVPGLFLRDAVSGGRGGDVELVLEDGELTVSSGRSTYRMRVMKLEDYPALPAFPKKVGVVNPDSLRHAIDSVAAGADDASPHQQLRGLRIEGAERLHLVGTDGFRFHACEVAWDGSGTFEATVPSRALAAAAKGMTDAVDVGSSDGLFGLTDGNRSVTTRTFGDQYAAWQKLIAGSEAKVDGHVTVDRDDILLAVKQVGAVTDEGRAVVLTFADSEITIQTGEQESGEGCEVIAAEGEGPDFTVGVNPRYLTDLLAACSDGMVRLRYSTKPGAAPFFVADMHGDAINDDLTLLLMSKDLRKGAAR